MNGAARRIVGHAMAKKMHGPYIEPVRMKPIITYLADNYRGHAAFPTVCLRVNELLDDGIDVTPALVDHMFRHTTDDWLTMYRKQRAGERDKRRRKTKGPGWTYFLSTGERIKIGYSHNPAERALSLSLRESNIMGVVQSLPKFERVCHEMWAEYRIDNTEWFRAEPDLLQWIEQVSTKWHYHHRSRTKDPNVANGYLRLASALGLDIPE